MDTLTSIDSGSLKKLLSSMIGIQDYTFTPSESMSRSKITMGIRHTLFYCIQKQNEIANQNLLFHKQGEDFVSQAIKDTMLYFLGVVSPDSLALESMLRELKRTRKILTRKIEEEDAIIVNGFSIAQSLITEGKEIGLIKKDFTPDMNDIDSIRAVLKQASSEIEADVDHSGEDKISLLQEYLTKKSEEYSKICIQIRDIENFVSQISAYGVESLHQRRRLESIGLFDKINFDKDCCPLCAKELDNPLPEAEEIRNSIIKLQQSLDQLAINSPSFRNNLEILKNRRVLLKTEIAALKDEIRAVYKENKIAQQIRNMEIRRGRVLGRISLWLESVNYSDETEQNKEKLKIVEQEINTIESQLCETDFEERKASILNKISYQMTLWAKDCKLEHWEYPYRFDYNKLTVIIDMERPITMQQMGSGSQWLYCHLIAILAFHYYFSMTKRPVPQFLFLDQPSQVYFPPETLHSNADTQDIRDVYEFIFKIAELMSPDLQVIIVDHADISESNFQNHVIEKWWDDVKLVPDDW